MQKIQLPMLKPISKVKKPKILLLSDDMTFPSGIATMSREFVTGLVSKYDWVQLGASTEHPDHGKIKDLSQAVAAETGVLDANVKVYCSNGYGTPELLRELLYLENPDAIMHFTDPRFWEWLYYMEAEIRSVYKKPILYYNIWDAPPAPLWNKKFYMCSDLIMNISKQTHALVKSVLEGEYKDILIQEGEGTVKIGYVPHGINPKKFFPIGASDDKFNQFKQDLLSRYPKVKFIVFWNNRNIRRKNGADLLLAYKRFCDKLKSSREEVLLVMHTNPVDPNGTDLFATKEALCPTDNVFFSTQPVSTEIMNYYYNIADVVVNIASNEGFGISGAEAIMAGKMIINNITGGLQDQCGFKDDEGNPLKLTQEFPSNHTGQYKTHGEWVVPVYPTNRSLQGSLQTPYIFDDRCDFEDVAKALRVVYNTPKEQREQFGLIGREWLLQNLSSEIMCSKMEECISDTLANWTPKERFELITIDSKPKAAKQMGIVFAQPKKKSETV